MDGVGWIPVTGYKSGSGIFNMLQLPSVKEAVAYYL